MRTALVIVVLAAACSRTSSGPSRDGLDDHGDTGAHGDDRGSVAVQQVPTGKVVLEGTTGASTVTVEVVKSPGLVQKGLMYRKFMPADTGMVFLMGDEDDHYFWMKNTFIPLDIMFISRDFTVAGILENMQPHDTNSRGVGKPSVYVLEVNAGYAKAHGISAGTKVRFEGVEAAAR